MASAHQKQSTAWLLLVPMLGIMLVVTAWPLLRTFWLSFTDTGLASDTIGNWVGLDNFVTAMYDEEFREGFGRTLYFTFVSVGLETIIGVLVALLLNQEFRGRVVMRALLVLPWALPTIVNAMMWRLIYNPEYGAFNAMLTQLGILNEYRSWLGDPASAMNMVVLADVWKNYPIVAMIALAALQTVPTELHEAARLDGANAVQRFFHVTLPCIMGPLTVALVLRTIEAFRVFDIIYVMTRGGPADSTKTVSFYVYQESFSYMNAGSGAAFAVSVLGFSALLIAGYIVLLRRQQGSA